MKLLIIDGYNLLRSMPHLAQQERMDPEGAREALLDELNTYKRVKGHKIVVVFDAAESHLPEQRTHHGGIKVIYTRQGELADRRIEAMAKELREKAVVITSDRELRRAVERHGAVSFSSHDFQERLWAAQYAELKGIEEEDDPLHNPKKGNPRRASKEQRKRERIWRLL